MRKILFLLAMTALTIGAYAQSGSREREEDQSQPEIDNLSGLKPDEGTLEESTAVSMQSSETSTTGNIGNSDDYTAKGITQGGLEAKTSLLAGATVYPNPATDFITINTEVESGTILIMNLLGQPMSTYTISGTSTSIDISALNEGIYFISIESGDEKIVKKLKVLY